MNDPAPQPRATETEHLNTLLTWLLTGVSQQFSHMLLLGKRGDNTVFARIKKIDDADFPNAMRIIDLQLSEGATVSVGSHRVAVAQSTHAILQAELAFEQRLKQALQSLEIQTRAGQARLARAKAPRPSYRAWLTETLQQVPSEPVATVTPQASPELLSGLLQLMEQTLLHALAYWHEGKVAEASTAWQICGAAMLYLTAIVDFCGSNVPDPDGISVPGSHVLIGSARFGADIDLVRTCATAARRSLEDCEVPRLAQLCLAIAEDCERITRTRNGERIDAGLGNSRVFHDFRRAARYLTDDTASHKAEQ